MVHRRHRRVADVLRFVFICVMSRAIAFASESGLTRIESYYVNMTIKSRFAKTNVVVDFVNERDCSAVRGFTMQLPLNSRVTSLTMSLLPDGCELNSNVTREEVAKAAFETSVAEGKPAALLTAWDSTNYGVEVSIPPSGKTSLSIHLEELFRRRLHQVEFQVPLSPGVDVEKLSVDVSVSEPESGISKFILGDPGGSGAFEVSRKGNIATAHLEVEDVLGDGLPRLLSGVYDTGPLPENGLLMADGFGCATLLFNPSTFLETGPIPRNIVFVIDVSGSMSGQKLSDAKAAFSSIIHTLTSEDFFAIHTFSGRGTEAVWEPNRATSEAKASAISFVNSLQTISGTNLYEAYTDGLDRVEDMQTSNEGTEYVPFIVILTDGQATSGITSSQEISKAVRSRNEEIDAKIFALAFGFGADLSLLLGISIQNGGVAVPIYEGYGDAAEQMESFYQSELGSVLMTDIEVAFGGDFDVELSTAPSIPVFANGSEVAIRALMADGDYSKGVLQATTTARTSVGQKTWVSKLDMETVTPNPNSECSQGWAHAHITELMEFREGALSLGSEMEGYGPFRDDACPPGSSCLADFAKERAVEIALKAGLVWQGLTALVTADASSCPAFQDGSKVCSDGDMVDSESSGQGEKESLDSSQTSSKTGNGSPPSAKPPSSAPQPTGSGSSGSDSDSGVPWEGASYSNGAPTKNANIGPSWIISALATSFILLFLLPGGDM